MDENENQLINSNNECRWFKGSPLALCYTELYKNSASGKLLAKIKFMNVQPERITAVSFDIICYGIIRNELSRIENYTIENLQTDRNRCFADSEIIEIENGDTMAVDILLKTVTADGGEVWTNADSEMFNIPLKQNSISSHMGRYLDKLRTEWSEKGLKKERLLYAPCIKNDYWLCACGTLNWGVEDYCCECGAELEWLTEATDVTLLRSKEEIFIKQSSKSESEPEISPENAEKLYQKRQKKDLEYERKNAIKLKKRNKTKVITGTTAALVIIAALILGVYYILIPANNYYSAKALIDEGKYDEAVEALSILNGYSDSEEQIKRAKYLKAEEFERNQKYLEAAEIFSDLGDYSDSSQKYNAAMYEYAGQQYDTEQYIKALQIFTNLGDYADSEAKAKKSEQAAFNIASQLFDEKNYIDASEQFLKIAEITGNSEATESSNHALRSEADKLYGQHKYVDALVIYESISGYDHVDATLKSLDSLAKILSTSIHIGDDSSVWERTDTPCSICHSADTLSYYFYFKSNGLYQFEMYCPNHEDNDEVNKTLTGQYKIEDDKIYTLKYIGGNTEWTVLAEIENITADNTIPNKNAKMVITNPFLSNKNKTTLTLYGNIVNENSSPL